MRARLSQLRAPTTACATVTFDPASHSPIRTSSPLIEEPAAIKLPAVVGASQRARDPRPVTPLAP